MYPIDSEGHGIPVDNVVEQDGHSDSLARLALTFRALSRFEVPLAQNAESHLIDQLEVHPGQDAKESRSVSSWTGASSTR